MTNPESFSAHSVTRQKILTTLGVIGLLVILFLQLMFSIRQESISWDEGDHLFSGYLSWKHADFGMNPEHPPLVKFVAALPLLHMDLRVPALQNRQFKKETFLDASQFMASNYSSGILFRARMAVSIFAILLGLLVFYAAREMFGLAAGFIALALFAFDPNILAHGALVTTDTGIACLMFASIYAFYRYIKTPTLGRLFIAGLATGLALAAKHTGVLLLPMLLLLTLCETLRNRPTTVPRAKQIRQLFIGLAALLGIAYVVLWSCYGFRYAARPTGLVMHPSFAEYCQQVLKPWQQILFGTLARFHILPESYLYGMADIQFVDDTYTAWFFGRTYLHGTRLYFPAVIAIKSTLPLLILLTTAAVLIITRRLNRWREILFLTIPPALYLAVAMASQMNIGMRHILPMYAFFYVLAAGAAALFIHINQRWLYVTLILVGWQAFAAVHTYPAYMAYANELWGGPASTHKYLSDSNVDWGQQLIATRKYLARHNITNCWFVYFPVGAVDPGPYNLPCKFLPTSDTLWWLNLELDTPSSIDGTFLISDSDLAGFEFGPGPLNPYEQFKSLKPDAVIQHGVYVFHGHFDIPLAAAFTHAQKAQNLLSANNPQAALPEAQQAVALAPDAVVPNVALGDVLMKLNRAQEARTSYTRALQIAKTIQPEFQQGWAEDLAKRLNAR